MRKPDILFPTLIAAALLAAGCIQDTDDSPSAAFGLDNGSPTGSYIVVLKPGVDAPGLARAHGMSPTHVYSHVLNGFSVTIPPQAVEGLSRNPNVDYIAPDLEVQACGQTVPTGVQRMGVTANPTADIDGVDERVNVNVAVLDTGIDLDHADLNVVGGINCNARSRTYDDENGHGTHVAGTIGALDNGIGVVGVAPGANLYAVRVLDRRGSGYTSDIVCGIDWVAQNVGTIKIASMSLGGTGSDDGNCGNSNNDPEHQAICRATALGVTFIVAAGNEADDSARHTPAAYDEVITVSALSDFNGLPGGGAAPTCRTDEDDTLANFSNFGPDVDIMAPGVCIYSTTMGGTYGTMSGTSMATPHVSGAAALILAADPSMSAEWLRTALLSTYGDTEPCASFGGRCADDPDGVQEPFCLMGALAEPVCGDGTCSGGETCGTCAEDCGACPFCGDSVCNGTETCGTCETDCGVCPAPGGMCDACTTGPECTSGLCLSSGGVQYCTQSCNIKKNNCPTGSTCIRIGGSTVCEATDGCPL